MIPAEIAQVFQNIVNNALDTLNTIDHGKMKISSGIQNEQIFFEVTDNGPGIPKEIHERIFEPFFTTKIKREEILGKSDIPIGTGLGLWMCQETVKSYGGHITLTSTSGQGAAFYVFLPKCD